MTREELAEIESYDLPKDIIQKLKNYVEESPKEDEYSAVTFEDEYEDIKYSDNIVANEKEEEDEDAIFMEELYAETMESKEFDLDGALDAYDPTFPNYTPSEDAFEFFSIMRLIEGGDFEFDTPIAHYFMVDLLLNNITDPYMFPYSPEICAKIEINHLLIAFMCSRGIAKSSVVISFFGVYSAIKGELPNGIGKVWFYLVLAASSRGGARVNALAVRAMCEDSKFLNSYFEEMRFTETESEFVRKCPSGKTGKDAVVAKKNRSFLIRYQGVGTGVRGIRYGQRRLCCHTKGTIVTTEYGTYPVEDHPGVKGEPQLSPVVKVGLRGLTSTEVVSVDHKYWAKLCTNNKCVVKEGFTKGRYKNKVPRYTELPAEFTPAEELTDRHWVGSTIDTEVKEIQPISHRVRVDGPTYADRYEDQLKIAEYMLDEEFWWMYGLWLGEGSTGTVSKDLKVNNKGVVVWYVADTQRGSVGKKLVEVLTKFGMKIDEFQGRGCYRVQVNKTELANWLHLQKGTKNSEKNMLDWVLKIEPVYQKQILLGYIAADGYVEYKHNHIRINSVNLNVLKQLQKLCSRLNLPSYIRNTKRPGESIFPGNKIYKTQRQWEIRLKENVGQVLGIKDFTDSTRVKFKQVHISNGMLWRQVKFIDKLSSNELVYPIECKNTRLESLVGDRHTYETEFGVSHNCIIADDIILNEAAAYSKTITENLESVIHSDSVAALKGGGKGRIINCFTPFNYTDVNTRLVLSGAYTPCVIPIAKDFDAESNVLSKKDIVSTWESYHPSRSIGELVRNAKKTKTLSKFLQERMLRLTSGSDRLVPDDCIQYEDMKIIEKNLDGYNIYITTDFTTTSGEASDFSGIATWAVNNNEDWFLLNLHLRKMGMETQYALTLEQAAKYRRKMKHVEIGVEIDGNQVSHIFSLEKKMRESGVSFTFAKQKGQLDSTRKGILSKNTGVNKHERFRIASQVLQQKKMWFPEHLRDTPDMREFVAQIKGATHEAFTRSDDGPDLITMGLVSMHVRYPSYEAASRKQVQETHVYGTIGRDSEISAYDSY